MEVLVVPGVTQDSFDVTPHKALAHGSWNRKQKPEVADACLPLLDSLEP